ncbi:MFS transporter [Leucobacter japonicus]|uniref:MFS transporter n=1 Tax=Leucobacter japonicus TaxID=1461259 RepID=UPI000B115CDC|nr:MFS transporter [Leucobacter japonicus]
MSRERGRAPATEVPSSVEVEAVTTPSRRVSAPWIAAFSVAWLGVWMAQLAPMQLLLPTQVERLVRADGWVGSVVAFGTVSGISAVCAIIAYPLAGALSDRTTSRWGRRRPWVAGGALLFGCSLVALGLQESFWGVAVCWSLAISGFCALTAALTAMIADQVPVSQRGLVSGFVSAPQGVGVVLGLLLVTVVLTGISAGYIGLAVALCVLVLPALRLPDPPLDRRHRAPWSAVAVARGFWISPRRFPDFGWTLLSRILVNTGNALGTGLLLYFLMFGLHRAHADDDLLVLSLMYTAMTVVASLVCGRLSDRLGRRKVFVAVSAGLQAVGGLLLAVWPGYSLALVAAVLLGLGYGCFLAVDQALATQVLPDAATRGKDLGIMNIANAVPQALAPLLGAIVVSATGGFLALFLVSGVCSLLGAWSVHYVRSVR